MPVLLRPEREAALSHPLAKGYCMAGTSLVEVALDQAHWHRCRALTGALEGNVAALI
jgi:hypothetical protein